MATYSYVQQLLQWLYCTTIHIKVAVKNRPRYAPTRISEDNESSNTTSIPQTTEPKNG